MSTGVRLYAGKEIPEGMSLSAFKKLVKQERMEAERDQFLKKRRAKRRTQRNKARRPQRSGTQIPSGVNVVLDCNFDSLMADGERTSLAGQLTRCYSENRKCNRPVNLTITGFNGKLRSRFENEMRRTHELWTKVKFEEDDIIVDDPSKFVYLTGDSDEVLHELRPGMTYFVGGIVDKNRYKNLCLDKAKKLGINVGRLPIDEHIKVSGRRVLTTNQVFELLLKWLELGEWKAAFEAAIPSRKIEAATPEPSTVSAERPTDAAQPLQSDEKV